MRSMVLALLGVIFLSVGVVAQNDLPKAMQDPTPINVNLKNVTISKVLTFLGKSYGVEVRFQSTPAEKTVNVQFTKTSVADVFRMLAGSAGLSYRVVDEKTLLVTGQ